MSEKNINNPEEDAHVPEKAHDVAADADDAPSDSKASKRGVRTSHKVLIAAAVLAMALVTVGVAALLVNINQRQQEAHTPFFNVVELDETTTDPEIWGQNFPLQFESYKRTLLMEEGSHGGSEALPAVLDPDDPRADTKSPQKLELDPRLVNMWKGYAFSVDYRELRGHAYMLHDQRMTERVQQFDQPGACLNCHASLPALWNDLGDGDIEAGWHEMNAMSFDEANELVDHPISCIDCHDPATMQLRVTRPAFEKGIAAAKLAEEGIKDYDVNRDASASEMRTFVCAQCHVEYYFAGDEKTLTFPWANGLTIDDAYEYYDEVEFNDWTHELTGAPMLKAQHPEFEMWNQGVHASSGVTCADCHMPYEREGAMKISDHQVTSPLKNVNSSCLTCHSGTEEEMLAKVDQIQDRHVHTRSMAQDALDDLIDDIVDARDAGATDADLADAWEYQRKASFYIDYVVSENSLGFHAPGESLRILGDAADAARKGQLALHELGED